MPRILFVASHRPDRSPAQRFRFEQYLPFLKENGYEYDFSYLINARDDRIFYSPGNLTNKLLIFMKSALRRLRDVVNSGNYDIIFVQREAFMTGSTFFERMFARSRAKLVFDFDDAIWHYDVSEGNRKFGWLKDPAKTASIISISDLVIAGNRYLRDFAAEYNSNVIIIPTTIDTDSYIPMELPRNPGKVVIGWSGSITTIRHFEIAIPFLARLRQKFGDRVEFRVIGDANYVNEELGIRGKPWIMEDEIRELCSFDIGIMPMPDDGWTRGKCGLKGLQYMALEVATVMSAIGVNTEIISDGVNGFLANGEEEWFNKISSLVEDADLRKQLGKEGRQTVISHYSVHSQKPVYISAFNNLLQ